MPELTAERARELFEYDPETGRLVRNPSKWMGGRTPYSAGYIRSDGYLYVRADGRQYLGHRLIWLYIHGAFPCPGTEIDHLNGERNDNRASNLRCVSREFNCQNKKNFRRGIDSVGAYRVREGKYISRIGSGGRVIYLGTFTSEHAAHEAFIAAKRQLHPGSTL